MKLADLILQQISFFSLSESTRKLILDRYVSRYEAHVTPSMVASVPSHGNEHMASEIMAVGPIQVLINNHK